MKRFLIGLSVFLGVAVFALVFYLAITDFSRYQEDFTAAISDATGREFRIDGEFNPEVFPLSFVAEEISLANADWGSDAPMLSIGHVSIKIDAASLLFGPLRITEFRLHDVTVLLEANADGEENWSLATEEPPFEIDTADADSDAILLDFAEVRNIEVTYRTAGSEDRVATLASLDIQTSDAGYINGIGIGSVDGTELSLNGSVGPVANLESGADVDFSFETYLGEIAFSISGNTGNPENIADSQLNATLTSDDVATVFRLLNIESEMSGPLRIESNLSPDGEQALLVVDAAAADLDAAAEISFSGKTVAFEATVSPFERVGDFLDIDGLPDAPLTAAGEMTIGSDQVEFRDVVVELQSIRAGVSGAVGRSSTAPTNLAVSLHVDDLEALRNDLPAISVDGDVNIQINDEQITLDPLSVKFADSDIGGSLDLHLTEPISITGQLQSELFDLTPFGEPEEEATADATAAETDAGTDTSEQAYVFTEEPLPFDFLNAGTVDVSVLINEFVQGPLHLNDVQADAKLADGKLELNSGFAVADGGSASGVVTLAAANDSATLDMDFEVSELRLSLSEGSERAVADIPLIGLAADFSSTGTSLREIAASTNGNVLFTQGAGKIDNNAIGFFSNDIISQLFGALNPFAKEEPFSIWECTVFALDINDGVATITPLLAQSEKLTIVADGQIDLTSEKLDIRFNTKPRRGVGVSADMFVTPFIQLGGTLAAPRIILDKKGVIVSGGAAILTGGISFFVQGAADRASGASDRCAAALAIANGQDVEME